MTTLAGMQVLLWLKDNNPEGIPDVLYFNCTLILVSTIKKKKMNMSTGEVATGVCGLTLQSKTFFHPHYSSLITNEDWIGSEISRNTDC